MNPFKDQIAPRVYRLLLFKKQQQDGFLSFRFEHSLRIYALGLVTSGSQQRHVFFGLFLKTLPGFDASHLHLSCYTGTDMPGEWTPSPVALETSAETMQQVSEKCSIIRDAIDAQKADA